MRIGITERGDASVDFYTWLPKLETMDGAILVTKDPAYLLDHLSDFDYSKCIIHCTITGFGGTHVEPNVPAASKSLDAYRALQLLLGGERVVLRIDPIVPTEEGITLARSIHTYAKGRVRISILDMYNHVKCNFTEHVLDVYKGKLHAPLWLRQDILKKFPGAEICGEPSIDCTGCVSQRDLTALGLSHSGTGKSFQRHSCACLNTKTELLSRRGPCKHGCIYCYWK